MIKWATIAVASTALFSHLKYSGIGHPEYLEIAIGLVFVSIGYYAKNQLTHLTPITTLNPIEKYHSKRHIEIILSKREIEVYSALLDNKTNSEIANLLFISNNTLKTHISNIYKKLNVKNRQELKAFNLDITDFKHFK